VAPPIGMRYRPGSTAGPGRRAPRGPEPATGVPRTRRALPRQARAHAPGWARPYPADPFSPVLYADGADDDSQDGDDGGDDGGDDDSQGDQGAGVQGAADADKDDDG